MDPNRTELKDRGVSPAKCDTDGDQDLATASDTIWNEVTESLCGVSSIVISEGFHAEENSRMEIGVIMWKRKAPDMICMLECGNSCAFSWVATQTRVARTQEKTVNWMPDELAENNL